LADGGVMEKICGGKGPLDDGWLSVEQKTGGRGGKGVKLQLRGGAESNGGGREDFAKSIQQQEYEREIVTEARRLTFEKPRKAKSLEGSNWGEKIRILYCENKDSDG